MKKKHFWKNFFKVLFEFLGFLAIINLSVILFGPESYHKLGKIFAAIHLFFIFLYLTVPNTYLLIK